MLDNGRDSIVGRKSKTEKVVDNRKCHWVGDYGAAFIKMADICFGDTNSYFGCTRLKIYN